MKIHDIISENKQVNEGLNTWWQMLKLLGNGPAKEAAESLGKRWAKELYYDGAIASDAAKNLRGRLKQFADDPKVIEAAKAYAEEAAKKAGWAQKAGVAATGYRTVANVGLFAGHAAAAGSLFAVPAKEYYDQMKISEQKLAAKEIDEKQFAAIRQHQMTLLIGRLAAAVAASFASKITFGAGVSSLRGIASFMGSPKAGVSAILADLLSSAQVVAGFWASDKIRNGALANLIAEGAALDITQESAGARGVEVVDSVKSHLGLAQPSDKVGKQEYKADPAKDATSQPPAAEPYDAVSQPTSPNQIKDPTTGKVRQRYADEY